MNTNRDNLAQLIETNRSWAKRMEDGYTSAGSNSSEHIADAIIAAGYKKVQEEEPLGWDETYERFKATT